MDHALIKDSLGRILELLSLPCSEIKIEQEGDILRVEIVSAQPSRIIGWHGESLNAIQHLLKSIVRSKEKLERSPFIVLEVDGYRKMQEEKVRRIAEQKADFVRRTGNRIALAPMSPYFRRIVHTHVANTPSLKDLTTESIGEGEYRQIVLKMKSEKEGPSSAGSGELSPVFADDSGLENLDV